MNETESDATAHTDIAGVFGRAVSRPLLEKTFHMKIKSRTVFLHRESFETILDKTEQMLLKVSCIFYLYFIIKGTTYLQQGRRNELKSSGSNIGILKN